tara:strand:+ start:818 stop:1891 length:1074 start_codon:yes stop_codon:yes gene_type:complete
MDNLSRYFKNKKILITGHTGFKGTWLTLLMLVLGAKVMGISYGKKTKPSLFNILNLEKKILNKNLDISNLNKLKKTINKFQPNFIFHLAAEAIISRAYLDPLKTWKTNTIGTINILQILKSIKFNVVTVFITSDKVYKNLELNRAYCENDILGDHDPYSASKASADLAIQSYFKSFLKKNKNIKIAIARAGNVIGGGDWSLNRIVPDCMSKWSQKKILKIRNPNSTRPWQHVFDVILGYVILAIKLKNSKKINGEPFNFGPSKSYNFKVISLIKNFKKYWPYGKISIQKNKNFKEATLLQLNSKKSKKILKWKSKLNLKDTIYLTGIWYKRFYEKKVDMYKFSLLQLENFLRNKKLK